MRAGHVYSGRKKTCVTGEVVCGTVVGRMASPVMTPVTLVCAECFENGRNNLPLRCSRESDVYRHVDRGC